MSSMRNRALLIFMLGLAGTVAIAVWSSRVDRPPALARSSEVASVVPGRGGGEGTPQLRSRSELVAHRQELLAMDSGQARAWILDELDRGSDYATGMDLKVGTDQNLTGWPSYRVYLLDMLYLVDPGLAARKSRELVEISQSPDEWAVALRNVAKADEDGAATPWLRSKVEALLRNRDWRENPSAGYLNAFDLIVHTRHTDLSPELVELTGDLDQKAVRHAAFLALDRLVQGSPREVLPMLVDSAGRYPQTAGMISNMMARADVRDPAQRQTVEAYLLNPGRTGEELNAFASVFPNANFHVSNNLLTRDPMVEGAALAARDRASLDVVDQWLEDPRFARIHPTLQIAVGRLEQFVGR